MPGIGGRLGWNEPPPAAMTITLTSSTSPRSVVTRNSGSPILSILSTKDGPTLLDLGPVVGPNIAFFGEHLGCKVLVEDVAATQSLRRALDVFADSPQEHAQILAAAAEVQIKP